MKEKRVSHLENNKLTLEKIFFNRLVKRGDNECWLFKGKPGRDGYHELSFSNKSHKAHRVSVFMFTGNWPPKDKMVCHKCDNPSCVNPNHLYVGDASSNVQDSYDRGRRMAPWSGVTHCIYGHEFTAENTVVRVNAKGYTSRNCRVCHRRRNRDWATKKRASIKRVKK